MKAPTPFYPSTNYSDYIVSPTKSEFLNNEFFRLEGISTYEPFRIIATSISRSAVGIKPGHTISIESGVHLAVTKLLESFGSIRLEAELVRDSLRERAILLRAIQAREDYRADLERKDAEYA